MSELIRVGQLEINFLENKDGTSGSLDMFELSVPPRAKVPVPHYHRDYDEVAYGLAGVLTWTINGKSLEMGPGNHIFIRRGAVHHFANLHDETARVLVVLAPGLVGPGYFREIGALLAAGPPAPGKLQEIMIRYGLVPVPE